MKFKDLLKDAYKDGMTLEEIEAALADVELPADQSGEIERLKSALSKSNSENAEWKKKHRDALSEDEKKTQEKDELIQKLTEERNTLLRESNVPSIRLNCWVWVTMRPLPVRPLKQWQTVTW